jgi:hypothetical protein
LRICAALSGCPPLLEILTRIRALRLPKENRCGRKDHRRSEVFPTLNEITREIENEGFLHLNDAGWDWEDYKQFFRLFTRKRTARRRRSA